MVEGNVWQGGTCVVGEMHPSGMHSCILMQTKYGLLFVTRKRVIIFAERPSA